MTSVSSLRTGQETHAVSGIIPYRRGHVPCVLGNMDPYYVIKLEDPGSWVNLTLHLNSQDLHGAIFTCMLITCLVSCIS
jgi:hypothetical protein